MHTQFCKLIILSIASYIFRPPTVAFKELLPEDGYNRWQKHFGGHANHVVIYLHIYTCICWLFVRRYVGNSISKLQIQVATYVLN